MNNERKARSAPQRIDAVEGHPRHAGRTMKRFFKDLMQQKWKLLAVVLCLAAASVCSVLGPRVLGMATNQIFDGVTKAAASGTHFSVDLATMGTILFALAGLYLLGTLLNYIPQRILASVSQDLSLSLRKRISAKINRLPLRYFDTHKKGQILSRVTSDLERVADTLQETIANMITAVMTLIGAFIMILSISPALTAIALGTVVASMLVSIIIGSRTNRYHAANQAALGELNANIEEAFTGNSTIKAFNLIAEMTKQNDMLNEKLRKTSTKAQFITYVINPVVRLIGQFGYVLIAVRGAMAVTSGALRIGDVQAAFQYVNQLSEPVTQLSYTANNLQGALASAERVYDLLDAVEELPDQTDETLLPRPQGNVVFENVRFSYDQDRPLMENINITVKAGSKVAIVGPTGSGKTTLVNLLMRFYELSGGRISIDGVDIRSMSRRELRSLFGMVLQDTWLFRGTVAENIAYGRDDATREQIREAAKAARVDHFIRTLPKGYDTILDDEIFGVSMGQKQLLTIARVILADPAILILDEATSSVDTRTEVEIQQAMNALMRGRTSFVIAHRLSTIRDADMILVMRNGTIVEQGTHEQLLIRKGVYAELYNSQFVPQTP